MFRSLPMIMFLVAVAAQNKSETLPPGLSLPPGQTLPPLAPGQTTMPPGPAGPQGTAPQGMCGARGDAGGIMSQTRPPKVSEFSCDNFIFATSAGEKLRAEFEVCDRETCTCIARAQGSKDPYPTLVRSSNLVEGVGCVVMGPVRSEWLYPRCEDAPCLAQEVKCKNAVQSKLSSVSECRLTYAEWANRGPAQQLDECLYNVCPKGRYIDIKGYSMPGAISACADEQLTAMCPTWSSAARIGQAVAVLLAAVAIFVL